MSDNESGGQARIQLSGLWKQESKAGKAYYSGNLGPGVQLQRRSQRISHKSQKIQETILFPFSGGRTI